MNKKNKRLILSLLIFGTILIGIGFSYAFFTYRNRVVSVEMTITKFMTSCIILSKTTLWPSCNYNSIYITSSTFTNIYIFIIYTNYNTNMTKFPVVIDLCVDRSCIYDKLKEAEIYIGNLAEVNDKEYQYQYMVAKCLKCGLCLEVCPNYTGNAKSFAGAVFANESFLMHTLTDNRKNDSPSFS